MLLAGQESIRDVIAFPKTTQGGCSLTGSPSVVGDDQLGELRISFNDDEEEGDGQGERDI